MGELIGTVEEGSSPGGALVADLTPHPLRLSSIAVVLMDDYLEDCIAGKTRPFPFPQSSHLPAITQPEKTESE